MLVQGLKQMFDTDAIPRGWPKWREFLGLFSAGLVTAGLIPSHSYLYWGNGNFLVDNGHMMGGGGGFYFFLSCFFTRGVRQIGNGFLDAPTEFWPSLGSSLSSIWELISNGHEDALTRFIAPYILDKPFVNIDINKGFNENMRCCELC